MHKILFDLVDQVPSIDREKVSLELNKQSTNIEGVALRAMATGALNVANKLHETHQETVSNRLKLDMEAQNLTYKKNWLNDDVKLRDPEFRKQALKELNSMNEKQHEMITVSGLDSDRVATHLDDNKIAQTKTFLDVSHKFIEIGNGIELDKRTANYEMASSAYATNPSVENEKLLDSSVDGLKDFKTVDELRLLKQQSIVKGTLFKDQSDIDNVLNSDLGTSDKMVKVEASYNLIKSKHYWNDLGSKLFPSKEKWKPSIAEKGMTYEEAKLNYTNKLRKDMTPQVKQDYDNAMYKLHKQKILEDKVEENKQKQLNIEQNGAGGEKTKLRNKLQTDINNGNDIQFIKNSTGIVYSPEQILNNKMILMTYYGTDAKTLERSDNYIKTIPSDKVTEMKRTLSDKSFPRSERIKSLNIDSLSVNDKKQLVARGVINDYELQFGKSTIDRMDLSEQHYNNIDDSFNLSHALKNHQEEYNAMTPVQKEFMKSLLNGTMLEKGKSLINKKVYNMDEDELGELIHEALSYEPKRYKHLKISQDRVDTVVEANFPSDKEQQNDENYDDIDDE